MAVRDELALPTDYDEIPYPVLCYTQTHPDRLATCASLLGLPVPDVEHCRVLELGCASGGNLLPMAEALPGSTFVGVDLSAHQIQEASQAVTSLRLSNIAFLAMDLCEITPALGTFDYIIAHGVYSWVPPVVRDALLRVCSANLATAGVAYISYNTYPGWHMLSGLREMMLYHMRAERDPHRRAELGRELVALLARAVHDERNQAYGTFMESYRELLDKQAEDARPQIDSVILHDELAEWNDPVYFWQFAEHAGQHGLQFLVEADFPMSMPDNLSAETFGSLQEVCETIVDTEQYMDFVRNRAFRRTLLCHSDATLDRTLRSSRVQSMAVATRAQRVPPQAPDDGIARFASPDGALFQTDDAVTIAALDHLAAIAPSAIPFGRLVDEAASRQGTSSLEPADARRLAANLLKAFSYSVSLVELHAWAPPVVSAVSEHPRASAYARYLARSSDRVPNLRHERVHLDPLARYVLPQLDGSHTRDDIAAQLDALLNSGALRYTDGSESGEADPAIRLRRDLDATLSWVARASLLVA